MEENMEVKKEHKGSRVVAYVFLGISLLGYILGTLIFTNGFNDIKASNAGEVIGSVFVAMILCVLGGLIYFGCLIVSIISTVIMSFFKKYKWEIIFPLVGLALPIITLLILILPSFFS